MNRGWILAGMALACACGAPAANFTNLDFEAYAGTGSDYLPGWEWDTNAFRSYEVDFCPLVTATVGLVTSNTTCGTFFEGEYSAFLSTGLYDAYIDEESGWQPICCGRPTISQTAVVPANAAYIRYLSTPPFIWDSHTGFHWDVRVQGALGGIVLSNGVTTDIRSLAGQEAELSFSVIGNDDPDSPGSHHSLDQIEFLDADGTVIWPLPRLRPTVCLEDFHAAALNTSLWEVATAFGQTNAYFILSETLRTAVAPPTAPFETLFRYRSVLRGDWDVRMDFDFQQMVSLLNATNPGVFGMALAADFGPERTATADMGQMIVISNQNRFFETDWGQGPTNELATTNRTGVFRLVRSGWEVAGYVWDAGSNDWRIVGAMDGYTDETARVGLKVWSTGAFGGKSSYAYADNLVLANGRASLDGLAIKTFGLDESGAPTIDWDAVGIPATNRYVVTRATSLVDSAWTPVSSQIPDAGGTTNWTGAEGAAGPFYYRVESVLGP